jgi:hypothetical protein
MKMRKTKTEILAQAMDVLAREIQSGDGVANAAIAEAAERLREQEIEICEWRDDRQKSIAALQAKLDVMKKRMAAMPNADISDRE